MRFFGAVTCVVLMAACAAVGQQEHPDAPSAVQQKSQQLPDAPQPQQQPTFPTTVPVQTEPQAPAPAPPPPSTVMPAVPHAPNSGVDSRDEMFKIIVNVNQIIIPVTVRDDSGHLVEGLLRKDFTILEDDKEQQINFFTSDPYPLSAAVVVDTNLPQGEMRKVNDTMGALVGAFSDYDEVAFYTYGSTVRRELDYGAMTERFSAALRRIKPKGQNPGPPVTGGPMGPGGPSINGRPVDPNQPMVYYPGRESEVLNDAILMAARELRKRDRTRRKIIFVISDGKEWGSRASFDEVRKILLSSEIAVYGVAVDTGALPGYRSAQKVHIPGTAYGDILNRYARDTGGEIFPELDRGAIEAAYARVTSTARNQYTIGYKTKVTASGTYRTIEVQVHRAGLKVKAKPGYFPLPPGS